MGSLMLAARDPWLICGSVRSFLTSPAIRIGLVSQTRLRSQCQESPDVTWPHWDAKVLSSNVP